MAKRPAYTLFLIKSDLLARADFGPFDSAQDRPAPDFVPLEFWEQPQPANVRLYHSLEVALGTGGKCGQIVWVVGEAFWTQTLSLPASALGGLTKDQIARAIGYDVEALTGLSGADSALGFCKAAPSDESEHLWITQVPLSARAQIQSAVEKAGGSLGGILHPGGLRGPLEAAFDASGSTQTWRRIEVWKDATLCLMGRGEDAQRVAIINGDPAREAWRATVARWMTSNDAGHSEWLGPPGSMANDLSGDNDKPWDVLPPLTGDALKRWLGRWAAKLANEAAATPVIEPNRANTSRHKQLIAVAAVTLACVAACIARGVWLDGQRTKRADQRTMLATQFAHESSTLKVLQAPKQEWDRLQSEIKSTRSDIQKLRTQRTRTGFHGVPDFELQRHRVAELLAALARNAASDLMIDHIEPEENGDMLIEGKCLPNTSVDTFAGALAAVLPGVGWEISPAQRKLSGLIPGGDFKLRVTPSAQQQTPDAPDEIVPSSALAGGLK
jgi:hypothetical protein